ncbi:MAG TPA: dihydrolipoamide acetyltransferase family protein [Steroidobacteraceae bacterium]|nr:dihydrolipoamide acetyltransferase family protein [Steroidobacteraceae bacterium]
MSVHVFKLPDLGEGTVSAEVVNWLVKPGDVLKEDQPLVEMSTDKAVVEIPAPVSGRVLTITGKPGDVIAVGAELATFDTALAGATPAADTKPAAAAAVAGASAAQPPHRPVAAPAGEAAQVRASPATRRRAQEAGVDLARVAGSGTSGRITSEDLQAAIAARGAPAGGAPQPGAAQAGAARPAPAKGATAAEVEEIPVIGIRRVIAQRMSEAARSIPHFSYVEEVDISALHAMREHLNATAPKGAAPLSYLPFIVAALVRALQRYPQCNAHYDAAREVVLRHRAVHVGIATQTSEGLKVPVVRNADQLKLRALAAEIGRVTAAARDRSAKREELGGSTITVTSLGKLGGIASTPIINMPEVAIIGVNRAVERPMVVAGAIAIRRMMNLSSSFDHRFVDGADAAGLIQALRDLLEHPATIFIAE